MTATVQSRAERKRELHTLESRKPVLMKEKPEGDLGEEGLEKWNNNLEAPVFFWVISLGLLEVEEGVETEVATEVRQRRPRPGWSGWRRD